MQACASFLRHRAGQQSGSGRLRLPLSAVARTGGAMLLGALLAACGTPSPLIDDSTPPTASAATAAPLMPKARRTIAQDILSEWGTFGLERQARRHGPRNALTAPTYSPSIREIIKSVACRSCEQKPYHALVLQASGVHGVPPALIHAVIQKESGYNPAATSSRRARGLMQLTPDTARMVGVENSNELYDPQTNINAGAAYLKLLMQSHDTMDEVLAAYNAGPGNVRRYNGVPPFAETKRYVQDVKRHFTFASMQQ
jgi:soluble lytic murein transglycosylase-like protein